MTLYKQWHRPMSKPVHHTSLHHIESNLHRLTLLSPTPGQHLQHAPIRFDQQAQVSRGHTSYRSTNNNEITEVHGGEGLEMVKPAREPAIQPSKALSIPENALRTLPVHRSLLTSLEENRPWSEFRVSLRNLPVRTPLVLAHRGSTLLLLVDDRAAPRPR